MKAKDDPRGVAFFAVRPEVGKASSRSITLVPAGSSSAGAAGGTGSVERPVSRRMQTLRRLQPKGPLPSLANVYSLLIPARKLSPNRSNILIYHMA